MAFTIKELSALSGIKPHTIRIWEQRYHFLKPGRTATNIRTYSNEELKTLLTVALLNRYGYKISRIDEMSPGQRQSAALGLTGTDAVNELLINELIAYMVDVQHLPFQSLLHRHIQQQGLAETVGTVILPLLQRVGVLWQTGCINPAQEHVVSHIIREKIIAAINDLPMSMREEPLFVLFLPEDEHHELGLLYVYYLLKVRGLPVLYLGADLPLDDLFYVVEKKQPAYLYLHLTSFPRRLHFEKYLHQVALRCPGLKIFISGPVAQHYTKPFPANVVFFPSLEELAHFSFES